MLINILILCAVAYGLYALLRTPKNNTTKKPDQPIEYTFHNSLKIKGARFNICEELDIFEGNFDGYLAIAYNEHDEYAVGVYRNDNVQVGWLPKKSVAVYNYLKKFKIKRLPCNGHFNFYQDNTNSVYFKTHLTL